VARGDIVDLLAELALQEFVGPRAGYSHDDSISYMNAGGAG
jgi:hypothetical protein